MTQVFESDCLYSTVRNISGSTLRFSFLPPHGRQLEDNEEFSVFGDIRDACIRNQRVTSRHHLQALQRALTSNPPLLEIVKTPAPILYDETLDTSEMLQLDNGTVGAVAPCWQDSLSGDSLYPVP